MTYDTSMGKLNGKTVFITGASSGIGEACAFAFAQEGARLLLAARRLNRLEEMTAKLRESGAADIHSFALDVSDNAAVVKTIENLSGEWRRIDVLVNNAGLSRGLEKVYQGSVEDLACEKNACFSILKSEWAA